MSWSLKNGYLAPAVWQHIYRFLVTSGCLFSRKVWWAVWIGSFWPKIEVFYRPEWTKGGPHDNEFWGFPNSELFQTFRSEKVDEKNGVICLVFMFFSWVIFLKLSKKVHFLQFCADLSTESRSIKEIFIYVFGRSRYALSENGSVYLLWLTVLETLVFEIEKIC